MWLKQSTAVTAKIGPFVDETDGFTAETGLTIAQADVRLSKNGGNMAQKNEGTACTHDEIGIYDCPLDATDTGTLGRLGLFVHESGARPVRHDFMVVPANVWDSFFGADYLSVETAEMASGVVTAAAIASGAITAAKIADNAITANKINENAIGSSELAAGAISEIADGVWDEATSGHGVAGTFGVQLSTDVDAILADTNELQTDLADGGRLDLLVDAIKAKTDNLPADPADDSDIDTQLAAIKAETALIVADTNELQTDWADGGRLDLLLDAVSTGAGAVTWPYDVTSSVDGSPVADVQVWVTTDLAGSNVVASGTTDANGRVTFYLDAGTVYVWRQKSGWNFTNPDTETVA